MADREKALVDHLDVDNYATWRVKIRLLLIQKGLWTPVTKDEPTNQEQDQRAFACIGLHMKDHYASTLQECSTSKQLWDKLEAMYKAKSTAKQLQLRRELNALKKDPVEPLIKYVGRTKDIRDQMRAAGLEIKDHEVALALLAGLPSEFAMVSSILTSSNEELKLDEMLAKLLNVEELTKLDEPKAYISNHGRGGRGSYVESRRRPSDQGGNQESARSETRECYYCHKKGHIRKDCRKRIRDEGAAGARPSTHQANAAVPNLALTARVPSETNQGEWVLDSGATRHITYDLDSLVNVREAPKDMFISYANGRKEKVCAIGDAVLSNVEGLYIDVNDIVLKDVLYVPKADINLLSIPSSTSKGYSFDFNIRSCVIRKGKLVICKVQCHNGVYSLRSKASAKIAEVAKPSSRALLTKVTPQLWHRRFGHLGYENLAKLQQHNMVNGISIGPEEFKTAGQIPCEPCVKSKQHKEHRPSSESDTKAPLELLHVDVCGPMQVPSLGGSKYIATFLDDYSKLSVVVAIANKSQVPLLTTEVIELLENQSGRRLRAIRSDNGTEYVNKFLSEYLKRKGIEHVMSQE